MSDAESTPLPMVAIVGRPNVGKSTLFNRILGTRAAIVQEQPGVTRDRKVLEGEWLGNRFMLMDTGGWLPAGMGTELDAKVSRQSEKAVSEADLVLFVVDGSVGIANEDAAVAEWLRRAGRQVIVVVNKADNDRRELDMWEFLSLGLGDPVPVSALHGRRSGDLLDEVIAKLPADGPLIDGLRDSKAETELAYDDEDLPAPIVVDHGVPRVALVGRPNVGKSTLFNRLIGEDRSVVHDMPGTTRDAIDTVVDTPDGQICFIDTAGMRRRSRVDEGTEYYSVVRALQAIDTADVALLVIDATEGVTAQDLRLAERVDAAGCPVVVMLNKWELIDDPEARLDITAQVSTKLHFIGDAPVLKISALTGKGVHKLAGVLAEAIERYHRRAPTREVNKVIAAAQARQPAPGGAKVLYALQGATDPPTFTLFTNRELPHTYMRYLENQLRSAFDFGSVPIKLRVRKRSS